MKHVTKKTLGVAALGAAITVAGAGVASANTAHTLEGAGTATSQILNSVPVEQASSSVPAATSDTLDSAKEGTGLLGRPHHAKKNAHHGKKHHGKKHHGKRQQGGDQLLGGLPIGGGTLGH